MRVHETRAKMRAPKARKEMKARKPCKKNESPPKARRKRKVRKKQ